MLKKKGFRTEVLYITKVTKILEKGKKISFKILVVSGNFKNTIGLGIGKDLNFEIAKQKAINSSYKNLKYINHFKINDLATIPFDIELKFKKTKIYVKPNFYNTGIRSGKLFYVLAKMSGFKNLLIKRLGSNNLLNNTTLFFKFLKNLNEMDKNYFNLYKIGFNKQLNFFVKSLNLKNKFRLFNILKKYNLKKLPKILENIRSNELLKNL